MYVYGLMRSQYEKKQLQRKAASSEIYPVTLLYGCGCWIVGIFLALAFWAFWGLV